VAVIVNKKNKMRTPWVQGAAAADSCRSDSESREEVHIDNDEEGKKVKKVKEQGDPIPQAPIKASQSMALLVSLFNLRCTNLVRGCAKRQCPGYRLVVDDATSSTISVNQSDAEFDASS
jgi:hypothetical protein